MFASGIPSSREAIAMSFEPCAIDRSKPAPFPNLRMPAVRCISLISLRTRDAPPCLPISVYSMPWRSSSSRVCVYTRAVTSTSCPCARRRSMIGRSTRTCAGPLMSAQIFISRRLRVALGSDRRRGELWIERVALHQGARALEQRILLRLEVSAQGSDDHLGDLPEVLLDQPSGGERGRPDPETGGIHRRALVERDRVAVDRDPDLLEARLGLLAAETGRREVH